MTKKEMFEMFFNCIVKMKYNVLSMGMLNMPKTTELVNIFDKSILKLYKLATLEEFSIEYELGKIEEYTDYPYTNMKIETESDYKIEVFKIIDHLLSHVKELRKVFYETTDYFTSDVIKSVGDDLYNFMMNY